MKKQTYIHIQEACHENWNGMSEATDGRFCHSCQKKVTDFSKMSDMEILRVLSMSGQSTCGRFATDQLSREIHRPATPAKKTVWAYILSVFLPMMAAERVSAQKRSAPVSVEQQLKGKIPAASREVKIVDCQDNDDSTRLTTNKATDGEKLDGNMKTKPVMMGLILEYDQVKKTDTISTIVKKVTGQALFTVYPNPVVTGKKASIKVTEAGTYLLQFMDLESKMISYKTVNVDAKGQIVFLDIPAGIAAGQYYLRMIKEGSNKQFVDKILVRQ